jgi:SAM-dependent methyltransferase
MERALVDGVPLGAPEFVPTSALGDARTGARTAREVTGDSPGGVVRARSKFAARLKAWVKHTPLSPHWTELYWLKLSIAKLAPHATGRLLDVGVGEKPHGKLFTNRVSRYIGLEYPPMADNLSPGIWNMLERVRGIIDIWGDGGALPFRDASFDTLLALEVLEHVPRPDDLMREIVRVLSPGGKLLVTVPFAAPMHQLPYDYQRFTEVGIRALMERHDLEVIVLEPRGNFAAVVGSLRAQHLMRTFGSSGKLHDGSMSISRWRAPLLLPVIALINLVHWCTAMLSRDTNIALGYSVVARRKPTEAIRSNGSRVPSADPLLGA